MVEQIPNLPDNVLGFTAKGTVITSYSIHYTKLYDLEEPLVVAERNAPLAIVVRDVVGVLRRPEAASDPVVPDHDSLRHRGGG